MTSSHPSVLWTLPGSRTWGPALGWALEPGQPPDRGLRRARPRGRYLRVRFEDLYADPVPTIRHILEFFDLRGDAAEIAREEVRVPECLGRWAPTTRRRWQLFIGLLARPCHGSVTRRSASPGRSRVMFSRGCVVCGPDARPRSNRFGGRFFHGASLRT